MPISGLPILDMLRTKMQWHQERQRVLAENIANADTPNFRPSDLSQPSFDRTAPVAQQVALQRTNSAHVGGAMSASTGMFQSKHGGSEKRPSGNAVSLEEEMLKVAQNQMDHQAAATLYSKSLGLVKTAVGKR
ncbi:flagellar basal body rod protein FlgB [Pseudorhodoplanes sp.]|uniref:flagellar basal body rod protein FlgB n=1 Tax=Pseudorhodoplanes sp. TaxID=1934341 RepID=UPI002B9D97E9|nr:flagellar basal body rod protein FlgB [Pseudorhodoplanes sp.]HWV51555.1 flagellar basal body rod protein FlgB [Pseudorhodoplanes sp.]